MFQLVLASAILVDFPQLRDIHHLIPQALDRRQLRKTNYYCHRIEDSDNWEIYVKYRKIVSRFFPINQIRSSEFSDYSSIIHWSGGVSGGHWQEHYVSLAEYLLRVLSSGDLR